MLPSGGCSCGTTWLPFLAGLWGVFPQFSPKVCFFWNNGICARTALLLIWQSQGRLSHSRTSKSLLDTGECLCMFLHGKPRPCLCSSPPAELLAHIRRLLYIYRNSVKWPVFTFTIPSPYKTKTKNQHNRFISVHILFQFYCGYTIFFFHGNLPSYSQRETVSNMMLFLFFYS